MQGLSDDEMEASLASLRRMCDRLDAQMDVQIRRPIASSTLTVAEVVVRVLAAQIKNEVRVAFVGGAQAGKSTIIAALSTGELDDGHGSARTLVTRHVRAAPARVSIAQLEA